MGMPSTDSDYDLMVIVSDDAPPSLHRGGPAYAALWGLSTGADVLVWTESSFSKRLHLRASLPSTVLREGILIDSI